MNVAILGLGRFGSQLTRELAELGVEVLAVDRESARVNDVVETAALAAEGNVEDVEFLESLSLKNYDSVVVAIGSDVATSVLVALTLKQRLKLDHVVAKASTNEHTRALELAGADVIVNPELESARRLAHTLGSKEISDYMALQGAQGIARVNAPPSASGRAIGDIDIAGRYNVFLLARLREDSVSFNPALDETVRDGDFWIVAGRDDHLRELQMRR